MNNIYHGWMTECTNIIRKHNEEQRNRVTTATLAVILAMKKKRKKYSKKRYWIAPFLQEREVHGFYKYIFPVIKLQDKQFQNYCRMSVIQFKNLLSIVGPKLVKQTLFRETVSPGERLAVTLRYLASGDSMASIQYQYLRGLTTVCKIIAETCEAIWSCLHSDVLPPTLEKEEWLSIAQDFEEMWNFNHCVGAIDGKHIVIQCPANAGSSYFNYKGCHSIVLLAICDARYIIRYVDIGAYGRGSDSTIFKNSAFAKKFELNQMNLPEPTPITMEGPPLPYCIVGDEAFPLTKYLLRPYPGKSGLTQERKIYNYRLSRARRMIENTFGILASQWRILRKPIICKVENGVKIVQAIVCLHNWLRKQDIGKNIYVPENMVDRYDKKGIIPGTWNKVKKNGWTFQEITRSGTNTSGQEAIHIRNEFCAYFNSEGAVPWQYK